MIKTSFDKYYIFSSLFENNTENCLIGICLRGGFLFEKNVYSFLPVKSKSLTVLLFDG